MTFQEPPLRPPPQPPLEPPVEVALARVVPTLPTAPPGRRLAYEPKFDGHRLLIFRLVDTVRMQARSGRIVTRAFPDLEAAARPLPPGTVLDGEVVVWAGGRTDFAAVQKRAFAASESRAGRLARELPASYAAFDLLAIGAEDLRPLPYEQRRARLMALLEPLGPPLQAVPMTTDPELAATWYEALPEIGVEGLVIKDLDQPYRPGRHWRKLRHSEARDAVVVGVVGPRLRPRALALVLPGDDAPVISAPLSTGVRAQLGSALRDLPDPQSPPTELPTALDRVGAEIAYRPIAPDLTVEVRHESTVRHAATTVMRLRIPD
ncbi:ATP-dependent DNA ligase [Streptomyces samsunensis]|uniref:ATP-dependent DNA ligase n=1 Tax=Streptomyces malaysiensis TaxID=92644 RepID=UPI001583A652|nr:ATP-dependent DNA ligase [Streptomyces samsunensis]MCC4320211.1 ATP-dependent DNA ligase [Streptomyces malaysiensis]NUH38441.1 ATP-dependent DNA ligase [Streptomyces samsunensis]